MHVRQRACFRPHAHYSCTVTQVRNHPSTPKQAASCCGPIDDVLDPVLFKALCDPTRIKLLACLIKCGRPCGVSEIAECCNVDLSVVSRHLQHLQRAGVLDAEKDGRTVFYRVRAAQLSASLRTLADTLNDYARNTKEPCDGTC